MKFKVSRTPAAKLRILKRYLFNFRVAGPELDSSKIVLDKAIAIFRLDFLVLLLPICRFTLRCELVFGGFRSGSREFCLVPKLALCYLELV
jgi:hypothetical protein